MVSESQAGAPASFTLYDVKRNGGCPLTGAEFILAWPIIVPNNSAMAKVISMERVVSARLLAT
jgi:hypothetical protein